MSESPTELGRVFIGRDPGGAPRGYEFHPFELEHDWQKRKFISKDDQELLHRVVMGKELILVGGNAFSCFEVAAQFTLDHQGDISAMDRLAFFSGEEFVEVLK